MNSFISYAEKFKILLNRIVKSEEYHAKWINTLSYLENCGARKIAACEHPTLVKEEILKHAAEEFRHAHYLKRQIERISSGNFDTYNSALLIGGLSSLQYLHRLDGMTSRYLKCADLSKESIKEASYLLVTYAIELRANELYHLYDEILKKSKSKITVKSILIEEREHLQEMVDGLHQLPNGFTYADKICTIEGELCKKWIISLEKSMS